MNLNFITWPPETTNGNNISITYTALKWVALQERERYYWLFNLKELKSVILIKIISIKFLHLNVIHYSKKCKEKEIERENGMREGSARGQYLRPY